MLLHLKGRRAFVALLFEAFLVTFSFVTLLDGAATARRGVVVIGTFTGVKNSFSMGIWLLTASGWHYLNSHVNVLYKGSEARILPPRRRAEGSFLFGRCGSVTTRQSPLSCRVLPDWSMHNQRP
jgi:hypothetical protein